MARKKINYNLAKAAAASSALTEQPKSDNKLSEDILLETLTENPYQPRLEIKKDELDDLTNSIKQNGLIQPIIVAKNENGGHIIIAGHRRVEAHKLLNKKTIKAILLENVAHEQLAILPLIENLQRSDMNPIENAIAFKRLLNEKIIKSQDELADLISVSKSWLSRTLSILKLPNKLLEQIKIDKYRDIHVLSALNKIKDEAEASKLFNEIKQLTRTDAILQINNYLSSSEKIDIKGRVLSTKDKIVINTKNIDEEIKIQISELVKKIEKLLK